MKGSGLGLATLLLPGVASSQRTDNGTGTGRNGDDAPGGGQGCDRHPQAASWFGRTGDRVTLTVSPSEWGRVPRRAVKGVPPEARRVSYAALEAQVAGINTALEAGDMEVSSMEDQQVTLNWTETSKPTPGPDVRPDEEVALLDCNRSDAKVTYQVLYDKWEVWLSDGNIQDLNALFDVGSGLSAILEALVAMGVLEVSTPPGVGLAIAGVLLIEKGAINWYNDGCGVKLTIYISNVHTVAFQTIRSQ